MKLLKIKTLSIWIAFFLAFLNPAHAYMTLGASDCGQWVNESKSTPSMRAWLLGFMSGLNAMHELTNKPDDPMTKINSAQQVYVWMDNFCQKNPLKSVSSGGIDLFIELMKK